MNSFARNIRPSVTREIAAAAIAESCASSFSHLERAHVLGQASTREHVRVHFHMLLWAWRHRDSRELLGQLYRLLGAALLTAIGTIPTGNTGGSNVSAVKKMAIPPDLASQIAMANGESVATTTGEKSYFSRDF
jgi:hypothetical protein